MTRLKIERMLVLCAVAAVVLAAGCDFTSNITLRNRTSGVLTPYPVVTDPPPPHREADTANNIPETGAASIDPNGFNPVYYMAGVADPAKANGVYIGLDLDGADPMMIQYKVFHYRVPPGEAGHDPAKQPILLKSGVQEVEDVNLRITVSTLITDPGDWNVTIIPE